MWCMFLNQYVTFYTKNKRSTVPEAFSLLICIQSRVEADYYYALSPFLSLQNRKMLRTEIASQKNIKNIPSLSEGKKKNWTSTANCTAKFFISASGKEKASWLLQEEHNKVRLQRKMIRWFDSRAVVCQGHSARSSQRRPHTSHDDSSASRRGAKRYF